MANRTDELREDTVDLSEKAGDMSEHAADAMSEVKSEVRQTAVKAPAKLRQKTQGNPAAVGLIAFGGGMLAGMLLPESNIEGRAIERVEPALASAASEASQIGGEVADDLKESAGSSMGQVRETASIAADNITEEA